MLPHCRSRTPLSFSPGRAVCFSAGGALSVPGQLCCQRTHGNLGSILYGAGAGVGCRRTRCTRGIIHTAVALMRAGAPAPHLLRASLILGVVALASLVPWTWRNLHTLHEFQPLAPRYANE